MLWLPAVLDAEICDPVAAGRAHLEAEGWAHLAIEPLGPPFPMWGPFEGARAVDASGAVLATARVWHDCTLVTIEASEPGPTQPEPSAALALIRAGEAVRDRLASGDHLVAVPRGRGFDVWLVRTWPSGDDPQGLQQTVARVALGRDATVRRVVEERRFWTVPGGEAVARTAWSLYGEDLL